MSLPLDMVRNYLRRRLMDCEVFESDEVGFTFIRKTATHCRHTARSYGIRQLVPLFLEIQHAAEREDRAALTRATADLRAAIHEEIERIRNVR
jgi:hypothetical protein